MSAEFVTLIFWMSTLRIELGSGNLKGSFGRGKTEDYTYDVPQNAIHVSMHHEDASLDTFNIGTGNGTVTLSWDKAARKVLVLASVNGAVGSPNEVRWTVYYWIKV